MITSQELLEAGFILDEVKEQEAHYKTFTYYLGTLKIEVTHEIDNGIVDKCYTDLIINRQGKRLQNVKSIEDLKQLIKLITND